MNPVSIIVSVIIIYYFFKSKTLEQFYGYILSMGMFSILFLRIGVFFNRFNMDIRYYEIFFYLAFFIGVCLILKRGLKKQQIILFFGLLFLLIINNLMLYIHPYENEIISWTQSWDRDYYANNFSFAVFSTRTLKIDINIIMFVTILYAANKSFSENDIRIILTRFVKYGFFVYVFAVIELLFKSLISSELYYDILNYAFGVISEPVETISRYGFNPVFGFCAEPQHFAKGLFVWILAAILIYEGRTKWIALALFIITSIFTTSFAALLYIGLILTLTIIDSRHNVLSLFISSIFLLGISSIFFIKNPRIFNTFILRFQNLYYMIFYPENMRVASEATRIISIIETFKYFLNRPIFGLGIGTTYAHGAITSLLSNIGLLGSVFWLLLTKCSIHDRSWNKTQQIVFALYLIAMFFTTTYWLAFYSLEYLCLIFTLKYAGNRSSKAELRRKNIDKSYLWMKEQNQMI